MKAVKWILVGLGGLLLVVIIGVAIFVATFDPNNYKPKIVELVKQRTSRTLAIDGKIGLTVFPKLGAAVSKVTLSEPNGSQAFARVEDARVGVALLPLLRKQVIVDRVTLKGLAVDLVRYRDGHTNFDDLTGQTGKPAAPTENPAPSPTGRAPVVDVAGITVENGNIGWRDERDGTNLRLANVNLTTGRLASGVPGKLTLATRVDGVQPKAKLQIDLDTGYRLDFETSAVALSSLDLKVNGDAEGMSGIDARLTGSAVDLDPKAERVTLSKVELAAKSKDGLDAKVTVPRLYLTPDQAESQEITGDVRLATAQRTLAANLKIPPLTAKGKQIQVSRIDVDLTAKQGDLAVQGALATPLTLDLARKVAQLPAIAGDVTVSGSTIPNKSLKATINGAARADWGTESADADLALKVDESNIQTKLAVAHWSQPATTFNVVADRLNLDRYFPPSKPGSASATSGAPAGGTQPEQPFDLSPLKTLNATGNVRIGAFQVSNIKAEQVALALKAAGGQLDVAPISANLYQGTLAGSLAVNANDNHFALKQRLSGVSVGPLLRDAANKDLLEGRGTAGLDVTSVGTTVSALKKALAGTANIAVKDGSLKGVDIAGLIRNAKALLGSKSALEQQAQGGAKTDFSELTASFTIKDGVAHNEDLQMKSPLLRLTGRGDLNIADATLDYTTKASIVAAATGQGGKEVGDVAGLTVPVRATGPLASLKYSVDVGALASELAKSTVQHELEHRLGSQPGGQPGSGNVAGTLGNAVRGLLGKPK